MRLLQLVLKMKHTKEYYDGLADGIIRYAHWREGVQYVGTTGKSLHEALLQVEHERSP